MISHRQIAGFDPPDYAIWLANFDDGPDGYVGHPFMSIGIGSGKRRQEIKLTREQVDELTRALQSMKTEL
jgi:hypothetical protein